MNRTVILRIFCVLALAFASLAAEAQVNPDSEGTGAAESQPSFKYSVYAGGAYTRIRQVPASYSGLMGGKVSVARNWASISCSPDRWTTTKWESATPESLVPATPRSTPCWLDPGIHMDLFAGLSGQLFAELGMEHTGSEPMSPSSSFAGGFGGGLTYNINPRWGLQLTGDRVGASFPLPGTAQQANSTHRTWNARGTIGIVYRF